MVMGARERGSDPLSQRERVGVREKRSFMPTFVDEQPTRLPDRSEAPIFIGINSVEGPSVGEGMTGVTC